MTQRIFSVPHAIFLQAAPNWHNARRRNDKGKLKIGKLPSTKTQSGFTFMRSKQNSSAIAKSLRLPTAQVQAQHLAFFRGGQALQYRLHVVRILQKKTHAEFC